MAAEGWEEKKICSRGWLTVKNEKGGGGGEKILTLSLPPTPNRPL